MSTINISLQTSKDIKRGSQKLQNVCSKCRQSDVHLQKCSQCHQEFYCSKQCQREDWPRHKKDCATMAEFEAASIEKMERCFLTNSLLSTYFHLALILEFKSRYHDLPVDKPFMAQVYIGIEPTDIRDFKVLWDTSAPVNPDKPPKGMLQLLSLSCPSEKTPTFFQTMPDFSKSRRELDAVGRVNDPVGFVEFVYPTGKALYAKIAAVPISPHASTLEGALNVITIPTTSIHKGGIEKPLTAANCLEFINMHIRLDTENKYALQRKMKWADMEMIMHAANGSVTPNLYVDHTVKAWKEKEAREAIYSPLTQSSFTNTTKDAKALVFL